MARLGDVCNIRGGYAFKSEMFSNNGIPVIRIGSITENGLNIDDNICFSEEFWNNNENYRVNKDDILIAMSGATVGKSCINQLSDRLLLNQRVASVSSKKGVNNSYIYYFVSSPSFMNYVLEQSVGCAQPNISIKQLNDIQLTIPTIDEQNKIVSVLNKATKLIDDRKQQLAKLDELVKARFVEMFGNVGTDEKSWGLARLGDVCKINPKKTDDTRLKSDLQVSFVPMPAVSEKGEIDPSEIKVYDEVKTGFTYFREDDVLFAKITPCMENGKGAVAKGLCNGIGFGSTEFHVLRPIENISNSYWIYAVTSFEQFRVDAASNMTGSAGQRRVPASFLESYRISIPPIELQNEFANFVKQVDKSKFAVQKALDEAQTLFDSLMQQYFG